LESIPSPPAAEKIYQGIEKSAAETVNPVGGESRKYYNVVLACMVSNLLSGLSLRAFASHQ